MRHGFSTRAGGVSTGPYESLNLGLSVGDVRENVIENLGRFTAAAGLRRTQLRSVSQVHGDRVLEATEEGEGEVPSAVGEADALWTKRPDLAVGVRTADCVPILIVDPRGGRVAAVHSGWRGTDLRIAERAVEALVRDGAVAAELLAAVGPCIQRCCYEVSYELGLRFIRGFGPEVVTRHGGDPHLDLPRAVSQSLQKAGLKPAHIDVMANCTSCDAAQFFSHRRDNGRSGRHISFVMPDGR